MTIIDRQRPDKKRVAAFTLVELLVSISVLILLIVFVSQLVSSATSVTTGSQKRMEADSQARQIFDRMTADFSKMFKRPDVDCLFYKQPASLTNGTNDVMFFYGEAPSYFSGTGKRSSVALIGYRINSNNPYFPNVPVLERLGEGLAWDGKTTNDAAAGSPQPTSNTDPGGPVFLTFPDPNNPAIPAFASTLEGNWSKTIGTVAKNYSDGVDSAYHVLSNQVYRLEISFLLTDGTISPKPVLSTTPSNWPAGIKFFSSTTSDPRNNNDSSGGYGIGSRWFNSATGQGYICTTSTLGAASWNRIGVQDMTAIIVGIGLLDVASQKIVTDTTKLIKALPDAADPDAKHPNGAPIAQTWSASNYLTTSGIPQTAASQLRIYQRYFYLNALNSR